MSPAAAPAACGRARGKPTLLGPPKLSKPLPDRSRDPYFAPESRLASAASIA